MKKLLIILTFFILITGTLYAQPEKGQKPPSGDEMAKNIVNDLSKKIKISPSKKDSINTILVTFFDDGKAYNKHGDKTIMDGLEKLRDEKISKILTTPEDFKVYLILMDEMKNRKHPQNRQEGGPAKGDRNGGGGPKNDRF